MLDWKILAASFASLLLISSFLVGGLGVTDFLGEIKDKLGQWFGGSTLEWSSGSEEDVEIIITPTLFTMEPNSPMIIVMDTLVIENFQGSITTDYENNSIILEEGDTIITAELSNVKMYDLEFNRLVIEDSVVEIIAGNWSEQTETGMVEIVGFLGNGTIDNETITLEGSVAEVIKY
ncbi:MAG: hypothetical protein ABIJ92_05070 [Candidatus Aenigmatarchaeota archaeon]